MLFGKLTQKAKHSQNMKYTILITTIFLFFVCLACARIATNAENTAELNETVQAKTTNPKTDDCVPLKFHYLVTQDLMMSPNTREIEVFLDEKAFSEENLKSLFRYLSDKNPDPNSSPNNLIIIVNTDWTQIPLQWDCPPVGISGQDTGRDAYDYHWARFYRREGREFFTYNPVKKEWKDKDVIIKGDKIFRNGKWQKPS